MRRLKIELSEEDFALLEKASKELGVSPEEFVAACVCSRLDEEKKRVFWEKEVEKRHKSSLERFEDEHGFGQYKRDRKGVPSSLSRIVCG